MNKSSKLIALSETYQGIDCNQLIKLCTKEADTVLFSTCGHDYQFTFSDGSAISFFNATITEWSGGKVVFEKTDEQFLYNYNKPLESDYDEFGKLIGD